MSAPRSGGLPYKVRVYDNFHYMDASESYVSGEFATYEEALAHAQVIVRRSCEEHAFDMAGYVMFGEDPAIEGPEDCPIFSAREFARQLCEEHRTS